MDVVLTPQASVDLRAVMLLRPGASAWGLVLGHKRGRRIFLERLFPAGAAGALPPPGRLDDLDRLLGRKTVGLYAVRPSTAFRKSLLAPYFYGRLFLDVRLSKKGPGFRSYVVEFGRTFRLAPARLETGSKGGNHE